LVAKFDSKTENSAEDEQNGEQEPLSVQIL
jgi:hypothetical protein